MITYKQFQQKSTFSQTEVLALAQGVLIQNPPAEFECRFPLPPMLMIDRVTEVTRSKSRGRVVGERNIRLDDWFFQCHFAHDPVQPGCLGVDAIWQLLGFYCAWRGALGAGRALGCKEVSFEGQIRPRDRLVRYEVDIRRYTNLEESKAALVIGSAKVLVDDQPIYTVNDAKVGVFRDIAYPDYPWNSDRSHGGLMTRM